MAPKKRTFAELGFVAELAGTYRADFNIREEEKIRHIRGPRRGSQQRALDDLSLIRTAAAEHTSRADGLEAMQAAAKRLKEAAAAEAGGVVEIDGEHRARLQYTDCARNSCEIKGPRRHDERRAQADLESMRAAAADKPTRAEHFEAMAREAHRLQEHAAFEVQVAIAVEREKFNQKHMQTDSETEPEQDPDVAIYDEPFPIIDVNNAETRERLFTSPLPRSKAQKEKPPADSFEATTRLATFRPVRSNVGDLRVLLEARADPNVKINTGSLSPLRNVMCFARPCEVREMRLLLLEHGAMESNADKKRWEEREEYDMKEPAWLTNFHRDDREG